jgi:hypothetical protein
MRPRFFPSFVLNPPLFTADRTCLKLWQTKMSILNNPLCAASCAGVGIHHAGMLRSDRNLMERAFGQGLLKVTAARGAPFCVQVPAFGRIACLFQQAEV